MEVVATPGHAPGHVSLYFTTGNLLVAGDALVADGGEGTDGDEPLAGPKPHFTPDMDRAIESVGALAALEIEHTRCVITAATSIRGAIGSGRSTSSCE